MGFKVGQHNHLTFEQFYQLTKRYGKDMDLSKKIFNLFKGADDTIDTAELGHFLTVQELANGFNLINHLKKKDELKAQNKVEDKVGELKAANELWETLKLKFDHNRDGNIKLSEIREVPLKSSGQHKFLRQFIARLNKNNDDTVTKSELMNLIYAQYLPKVSEDLQKAVAKKFGGMGDKRMNEAEFQSVFPMGGSITGKVFAAFKGEDGMVDASAVAKYFMAKYAGEVRKIVLSVS